MFEQEFFDNIQKDVDNFLDNFLDRETPSYKTDRRDFRQQWYAYQDEYAYNF